MPGSSRLLLPGKFPPVALQRHHTLDTTGMVGVFNTLVPAHEDITRMREPVAIPVNHPHLCCIQQEVDTNYSVRRPKEIRQNLSE